MIVTFFSKLTDPKTHQFFTLQKVLDGIKTSNGPVKATVEKIRASSSKEEREELKKTLPLVLFSGKFSERRASALLEYNKIITIDFDDVGEEFRWELMENAYVLAAWRSPYSGFKALVKVSSDNHLGHALALLKEFPEADPNAIKDVCRATFLSSDKDLYYNPDASVFDKILLPKYDDSQKYENLKKWLENKGSYFQDGQRNSFITKIAGAANRFGIDRDFLKERLLNDYVKGSSFSIRELQTVVDGIYKRYEDQFATVSADEVWSNDKVEQVLSTEIEVSDVITLGDVREDLIRDFEEGTPMGNSTYFPLLDNHFRFQRGEQTTVTGISSAGKSTMLSHLLLVRAAFTGEKVGFLSMEQYPPVYFYREFIRMIIGKPLEKDHSNRMTRAEYDRGMEWVRDKFFFIYPESTDPTPEWTLARFAEVIVKYGVDTVVVDPHNSQSHDYKSMGGRDDRYIAAMLRKNERFALQNGVHFFNVAHPRGLGKKEDGTYKEPSADEISGGPAWWQCNDNILVHHRPSLPLDFQDNTCTLRSAKIKKQPKNGRPGVVDFKYDWSTGRFFCDNYNPLTNFKL